jgi:hypothetical protein
MVIAADIAQRRQPAVPGVVALVLAACQRTRRPPATIIAPATFRTRQPSDDGSWGPKIDKTEAHQPSATRGGSQARERRRNPR